MKEVNAMMKAMDKCLHNLLKVVFAMITVLSVIGMAQAGGNKPDDRFTERQQRLCDDQLHVHIAPEGRHPLQRRSRNLPSTVQAVLPISHWKRVMVHTP